MYNDWQPQLRCHFHRAAITVYVPFAMWVRSEINLKRLTEFTQLAKDALLLECLTQLRLLPIQRFFVSPHGSKSRAGAFASNGPTVKQDCCQLIIWIQP